MSDDLTDRIAQVIAAHGGYYTCPTCDVEHGSEPAYQQHLAAAIVAELTRYLPPIFASAIHSWADAELAAISHHGELCDYEVLDRLNMEAAQIANYATTHEKWNGAASE